MSQNSNLDNVIRIITTEEVAAIRQKVNWTDDKVIRIDIKKGQIVRQIPVLWSRRHIKYYWVSTQGCAEAAAEVTIKDFSSNLSTVIKISYEVKCQKGNEEKVVLALYKGDNPTTVFNQLLNKFTQTFTAGKRKSGVNPVLGYFQYREELKKYLVEQCQEKVGLESEIVLALKFEQELKVFPIKSNEFSIRVKDCDDEMKLKFETELSINGKNKICAILNYPKLDQLENFMQGHIKKFVLKNISLHEFAYDLNDSVKSKLTTMLNSMLEKKGREIAWLRLEGNFGPSSSTQTMNIHHTVHCDIKDYSKKIEVEHKLLMQLEDIGKYKAKQSTKSLKECVQDTLNEITQNALFEKRYVNILLDFEKEEEEQETLKTIRDEMQQFADSIGYTLKHLIVAPNMKPLIFKRDGFIVKESGDFSTLNNKVNVKLDIVATGKISDLSKIPQFITPEKDIEAEMKQVISNETEKQMHNVDPEKFYMPFKFPDEETIEDMLKAGIKERLETIFFACDVNVIIKRLETDLIQRILNLINGNPYHLDVGVMPLRGGGTQEKVAFEVEFLVETVSRWNTFIYKNFESYSDEINKVKDALEKDISEKFQKAPYEILRHVSIENSRKLLEVARKAHSKITSVFGLDINVTYIKRKPTKGEDAQQKILEGRVQIQTEKEIDIFKKEKDAAIKKVEKLHEMDVKYVDPEYSDEDPIEFTEKELKKIKDKSLQSGINSSEVFKLPAPESPEKWSPDDYIDEFESEVQDKSVSQGNETEKLKDPKRSKKGPQKKSNKK